MKTTKSRAIRCVIGAGLFVAAAGLGIGLHHPSSGASSVTTAPTSNPVAVETARLVREATGPMNDSYAACIAQTLVYYGAEGDKWDGLVPSDRELVTQKVKLACPSFKFGL